MIYVYLYKQLVLLIFCLRMKPNYSHCRKNIRVNFGLCREGAARIFGITFSEINRRVGKTVMTSLGICSLIQNNYISHIKDN